MHDADWQHYLMGPCWRSDKSSVFAVEAQTSQSSSIQRLPQTDKYAVVGAQHHDESFSLSSVSGCWVIVWASPSTFMPTDMRVPDADLGGTQLLVEEGRWYTCNRLQVGVLPTQALIFLCLAKLSDTCRCSTLRALRLFAPSVFNPHESLPWVLQAPQAEADAGPY